MTILIGHVDPRVKKNLSLGLDENSGLVTQSGAQADAFTKDCSVTMFHVLFAHAHASLIGAASGTVQQVWPINQGVL